jgi:hypothetical protein
LKTLIYPLLIALAAPASIAATSSSKIQPFTSLCIVEQSTGFNWKVDHWERASFKPDQKTIVRKVDITSNEAKSDREKQVRCEKEFQYDEGFGSVLNKACYLVKEYGKKPLPYDAEMCVEAFQNGVLKEIECDKFKFVPDGEFIRHSKMEDISSSPAGGTKDSIFIEVGKCSQLEK